jgi:hypothetical protein
MPTSTLFWRELYLSSNLLFKTPPDKEQSMTDYMMDIMDQLHDIHHYAHQHLKVASDRMKAHYDRLANSTGLQKGDQVWLYCPMQTREKSPKSTSTSHNTHFHKTGQTTIKGKPRQPIQTKF